MIHLHQRKLKTSVFTPLKLSDISDYQLSGIKGDEY